MIKLTNTYVIEFSKSTVLEFLGTKDNIGLWRLSKLMAHLLHISGYEGFPIEDFELSMRPSEVRMILTVKGVK